MTEAPATNVDTSGISRTTDGTIQDGQTTQTDQSPATTNQDSTTTTAAPEGGGSLLNPKETKPEAKPEEPKKDGDSKAPETYADYTVPDGYVLDPEIKKEADALFKGMDLTQEEAQALVNFYTSKTSEAFQAPFNAYREMRDGWVQESMNHPDLRGKLGAGKEVTVRIAKLLDGIGDAELTSGFRKWMDLTGAGDNVYPIRVLDHFAKRLTEGTHVAGKGPSTHGQSDGAKAPPSAAAAMWPSLPSGTRQ